MLGMKNYLTSTVLLPHTIEGLRWRVQKDQKYASAYRTAGRCPTIVVKDIHTYMVRGRGLSGIPSSIANARHAWQGVMSS